MASTNESSSSLPHVQQAMSTIPPSENPSLGPLARQILPRVFKLYNLTAGPADYDVYSRDAVFEDPLLKAQGIRQIKSAFYSMQVLFAESGIREYMVAETATGEGSGLVVVDNIQHYRAFGQEFDVVSQINLTMKDGLITSHKDLWDKKPLATYETRGLVGSVAQGCRATNMALTHLLMGFGRDLKPRK